MFVGQYVNTKTRMKTTRPTASPSSQSLGSSRRGVLERANRGRVAIERFLRDQLQRAVVGRVQDRLRNVRMEMRAGAIAYLLDRNLEGHALAIRPVRRHCVDRVRGADDPCEDRQLVALLAIGIALPVIALVV